MPVKTQLDVINCKKRKFINAGHFDSIQTLPLGLSLYD
jgi:hypothetical protein